MSIVQTNKGSKYKREARLNMESMFHVKEGKPVTIANKPHYELANYTISFFVQVNTTFSFTKGGFVFTQADIPGLKLGDATLVSITNNAIYINRKYVSVNNRIFNNPSDIVLSGDFSINHLAIFNKALTQDEINFIHTNGGIIPASTHASCVAHYPLTQWYGKKAFDVVEQYNYAKPIPIRSWETAGGVAVQKLVGDGYIEVTFDDLALAGYLSDYRIALSPNNDLSTLALSGYSLNDNYRLQYGTAYSFNINGQIKNIDFIVGDIFKMERIGSALKVYQNEVELFSAPVTASDLFIKVNIYSATKLTHPIYLNGFLLTEWNTQKALNTNGRLQKSNALSPSHADLINYTDLEAGIPDPSTNTSWLDFYNKLPTNWIGSTDVNGNIIESRTGLPEIKGAINILNTHSFTNIAFGDEIGKGKMTMLLTFKFPTPDLIPSSSNFLLMGSFNLNINSTGHFRAVVGRTLLIMQHISTQFMSVIVERDHSSIDSASAYLDVWDVMKTPIPNITGDLTGGNLTLKGLAQSLSVARMAFWNRFLTASEKLSLCNNILLANPDYKMKNALKGYYLYDESQFYIEGTEIKQKDLSENNRHLTATGFAGATPAEQLIDLKNSLIDINDLR